MKHSINKRVSKPFLRTINSIVSEVNTEFEKLTGYTGEELLGKSVSQMNKILRTESQMCLENISERQAGYIFSKELEPREVAVSRRQINSDEQIFLFCEKKNSRLSDLFPYVLTTMRNNETGVVIYSAPGRIVLKANKKFLSYLNVPECNLNNYMGMGLREISEEFDKSMYERIFSNVVVSGKPFYSKEFKVFNDHDLYWDVSLVPISVSNQVKYMVYTVSDVTERVMGRKKIEEQKRELEAIIENMSDGLFMVDSDLNMDIINSVAKGFEFGQSNMKLSAIGQKCRCCDMEGNPFTNDNFPLFRVLKGERLDCFRFSVRRPEGTCYFSSSGSPIYDQDGNIAKALICTRDITEYVRKERQLKQQKENNIYIKAQYDLLNKILKNLDFGILRCSYPDLKVIDYNHMALKDFSQIYPQISSLGSIRGMMLADIVSFCDKEMGERILNIKYEKNTGVKQNIVESRGKVFRIVLHPMYGLHDRILEMIFIAIDITEEVKSKEEVEAALRLQDEIYANASHELKTPLSVIFSASQVMEMYLGSNMTDNSKKLADYNNIIKQNCYRLTRLINNIIDLSKCRSGYMNANMSNENIVEVIGNIAESVSEYVKLKGLSVDFETDIKEKTIACDINKIERVILNLISNAIKFSKPDCKILISIHDKGDVVEIRVEDNGIGIDGSHLGRIFDIYYQADKSISRNVEGSGIGLSLVKEFIELHGGNISVESHAGVGSVFKVELLNRTVENPKFSENTCMNSKKDMINIEFSDIYDLRQ